MVIDTGAPVAVGAKSLELAEFLRAARGAPVVLAASARDRIVAARRVVDAAIRGDELIYGLNTGLGHQRDERVPIESLGPYQEMIIRAHAGGIGEALPTEIVRAAMLARVAGLAQGGAGASLAATETLLAMLNAGVHPIVPRVGSVGASDLMHMAAIALVVIGLGEAEHDGQRLTGGEALRRAGIAPLRPQARDGLALVSANGVAIGHGALVVDRARRAATLADEAAALSLEATRANLSIIDPAVATAKGIAGQEEASRHLRELLSGSRLWDRGAPRSVQDALAFRVVPQVHGAYREFVRATESAVVGELNAIDDNPLLSIEDGRFISNGNFHPMLLALSFDALRPAVTHVGQIADRRIGHLWDAAFAMEPASDIGRLDELAGQVGWGLLLRYAAAARYAELRSLAGPATLDIPPLDSSFEDHATNAPWSVERTEAALDCLEDLLVVELLTARVALRLAPEAPELGTGTSALVGRIDDVWRTLPPDAGGATVHAAAKAAFTGPTTR